MSTDHRKLGQVVLRLQVQHIRSTLAGDIKVVQKSFRSLLQFILVWLLITDARPGSQSFIAEHASMLLRIVTRFMAYSNKILAFLDFHSQQTGLPSGGDTHLEKQMRAMKHFVGAFLAVLVSSSQATDYPGRDLGLVYDKDVKVIQRRIWHLNADISEQGDVPNFENISFHDLITGKYWHAEVFGHPLFCVPGTQWHKFFGNVMRNWLPSTQPMLFEKNDHPQDFVLSIPFSIRWLEGDFSEQYARDTEMLTILGRFPDRRPSPAAEKKRLFEVQRRLLNYFEGSYESTDPQIHYSEDTSQMPRPQSDILGNATFTALNFEVNLPKMAGTALLGNDASRTVDYLESNQLRFQFGPSLDNMENW